MAEITLYVPVLIYRDDWTRNIDEFSPLVRWLCCVVKPVLLLRFRTN